MTCFTAIGALAAVLGVTVFRGFALEILWGWFIVPLGVVAIGKAHALGVSTLVAMLTHQAPSKKDEDGVAAGIITGLLIPLFALGFGWVAHQFM